jgi:hypothetical protein
LKLGVSNQDQEALFLVAEVLLNDTNEPGLVDPYIHDEK